MPQTSEQLPVQTTKQLKLPEWPTSRPGPKVTEPPAGTRRVHLRTEQVVELDYDQERGRSTVRDEK